MIGKTISHYKILEKLGEGGMAEVYKAEDTRLKRIVALKFPSAQSLENEEEKRRFILEAQAAAALDHPNICTLYDIHEDEERTFISMAYVDGKTLEEKTAFGPLSHDEALDIAIQVAGGLKEAHEMGIVHRDIKSANIIVNERGQAKITDFGLAKLLGRTRVTERGKVMGTVDYMSPEQAQGEDADHRTDIWSLGVVMYKMLTAMPPFDEMTDAEIMHRIVYGEPEPIHTHTEDIPSETCDVIAKMLQKDPVDRYENMAAVIKDLKDIESGISIVPSTSRKKPSIAVLPFANISGDKEQEYFCDGLTEELITALSQIRDLHVVARTSAFAFKDKNMAVRDIGNQLRVDHILEGSVRKSGNRLRITGQLVNVRDGYHLWSERYDRDIDEFFAIQDEITKTIVDKLQPKLLGEEKARLAKRNTVNMDAHNLYLRGRYLWNKRTVECIEKSREYFEQAIAKDANYAAAYAGLADYYLLLLAYMGHAPRQVIPKAREMAVKALEIDDTVAEAHTSLAMIRGTYDWDWEGAEKEFKRAIELNPGYTTARIWHSFLLSIRGRSKEAKQETEKALELDPFSPAANRDYASELINSGEYDRAIEILRKAVELDPHFGWIRYNLGAAYWFKGMYEEALEEFRKARETFDPRDNQVEAWIGATYALMGKQDEARKILDALLKLRSEQYVSATQIAGLSFILGDIDEGFKWLETAYEDRDYFLVQVAMNRYIDILNLRTDRRYVALFKKMGLDK